MVLENALILLRVLDLLPSNDSPLILACVLACHFAAVACIIVAGTAVGSMVFDRWRKWRLPPTSEWKERYWRHVRLLKSAWRGLVRFLQVSF